MTYTLPIYYEQTFVRKPSKTWLVGDNAYRNWHYHLKNKVKQHYHGLIEVQAYQQPKVQGQFKLHIKVYYKNPSCDASNIASRMEKFSLDAFQEHNVIENDNVKYHIGTTWEVAGRS